MSRAVPICLHDHRGSAWLGQHHPEIADLRGLFAALPGLAELESPISGESWRRLLPPSVWLVRVLGPRTAHLHLRVGARVQHLVVKRHEARELGWLRWADAPDASASRRSYLWSQRLRKVGLAVPRPLGFLEVEEDPLLGTSFLVAEHVGEPTFFDLRQGQGLGPKRGILADRRPSVPA